MRRELERVGGLERALIGPGLENDRRPLTNDLLNLQTSYYLSNYFGDNPDTIIPIASVYSETESIKKNSNSYCHRIK